MSSFPIFFSSSALATTLGGCGSKVGAPVLARVMRRLAPKSSPAVALGLAVAAFNGDVADGSMAWVDSRAARLVCGLLSIPALHGLIRLPPVANWEWPLFLGRYAMAIYLFNTLAIGFAKALLIAAGVGWTREAFPVHVAVLAAAGLAVPIAVKALLLRRQPTLDRLTD